MAKGMADIFGKGGGGGLGGGSSFGGGMEEDTEMDTGMDMEDEEEPQGDLASALATAGYPNVTPDQLSQIEAILGAPGMGEEEGMDEGMGEMGGGMPPMPGL